MRRLYSTFASGLPGVGLLIIRMAAGSVLFVAAAPGVWSHTSFHTTLMSAVLAIAGLLLIAGLWTPVAGTVAAGVAILQVLTGCEHSPVGLLAAIVAAALAMLGPGRWSVDARLFGWKRIEPRPPAERAVHAE